MIFNNPCIRFFTRITYPEAAKAQERIVDTLFKNSNVVSVGVRRDIKGSHFIKVGLKEALQPTDKIPDKFDSVPIVTEVEGEIKAL